LTAAHVRQFTITGVSGFVFESRSNDTPQTATSLSLTPNNNPDGSFAVSGGYGVGSNPYFVAAGLLNADTNLDLVTANNNSDNVSVRLGNGDGTFGAPVSLAVEPNPRSVAIGDLDGDGKLDLVSVNAGNNTVSVLFGHGDGTFASRL